MPKYIINWDAGYGMSYEVIEAKDEDEAIDSAYEYWHEEVESNANYGVEEYTKDLAIDYGLEEENNND